METTPQSDFEKTATTQTGAGIVGDFWYFLKTNKKWWLLPILVILLGFGLLMLLSGTAAAPFIYTLF
jgi:hypothetical protein